MEKRHIQFSVKQIVLLHLLPGLPILLLSIILTNPTWGFGLPMITALYISIAFALIPVQLLIILLTAKYEQKKISEFIFLNRRKSKSSTLLWVITLFIWSGIIFTIVPDIDQNLFPFYKNIPQWFLMNYGDVQGSSRSIIFITAISGPIINGLLGPITEEIYFRGFLLPRMKVLGKAAPLVNAILFSLYHFFSPWQNITRILALFPYIYIVWKKENIRIGMYVHCLSNLIGAIAGAILLLS